MTFSHFVSLVWAVTISQTPHSFDDFDSFEEYWSNNVACPSRWVFLVIGLPWWLSGKEFTCNAGDTG